MQETDTVLSFLRDAAARNPQATALRFFDVAELDHDDAAPQILTYGELVEKVIALANGFRALAGNDSPVVSLLIPSTIEGVVALLAAEIAGRAHPINHFLDAATIRDSMAAAGTQVAVAMGPHPTLPVWDRLQDATRDLPGLRATVVTDRRKGRNGAQSVRELIAAHPSDRLSGAEPQAHDLAALFNTAGTTGRPKIVPLTHANLLAAAGGLAQAWQMSATTRIVNALPFFHVAGANLLLLAPLVCGAEILLLSETGLRNPQVLARHWDIVQSCRPTIIGGIPSSLIALLDVPVGGADISSVSFCATGGAPLPAATARQFQQQFGLPIHTIYGMTETAGLIATLPVGDAPDYETVGQILPGTDIEVRRLTADGPSETVEGNGVICVRGPQVFAGYIDAEADEPTLLPGGWLATGDMGCLEPGGRLSVTGRSKDIIIRSGNNIDPVTIEVAANSLASVSDSAAVAMPDRYAGEVPALFVVARDGQSVSPEALDRHLRQTLADPHAQPARIAVIERMPLTSVGKISRIELRRLAAEAAVRDAIADIGDDVEFSVHAGPDGRLEVRIAAEDVESEVIRRVAAIGLRHARASG